MPAGGVTVTGSGRWLSTNHRVAAILGAAADDLDAGRRSRAA